MHQNKYFGSFWGENLTDVIKFQQYHGRIMLGVCKFCDFTQNMQDTALFSAKIYPAIQNVIRPPVVMVVTVVTNHNSGFVL